MQRVKIVLFVAVFAIVGLVPGTALASSPGEPVGPVDVAVVAGHVADSPVKPLPDGPSDPIQLSLHTTIASDYRFRGTSYSQGEPVAQATVIAAHESGLFGGVFVSTLGNHDIYGAVEADLFVGWATAIAPAVTAEVILYYYYYPDANPAVPNTDSFDTAVQLTGDFGAFAPKVGVWYSWAQAALGGRDNLYLFGDLVWRIPGIPIEAKVHAGYTDGAYSISADRTTVDWSAGITFKAADNIRLGLEYVGMGGPKVTDFTDDTVVASLSMNF